MTIPVLREWKLEGEPRRSDIDSESIFCHPREMGPQAEPSTEEKQLFYAAMDPKWKEIATALAADRPPDWEGFLFEATIIPTTVPERFQVSVSFGDRVSNRQRGGAPKEIVDKIAELRMTYADFWEPMAWKKVTIEQIWDREKKSWSFETKWAYEEG